MKEIIQSKYAAYFFAGLVLTLLCAWFSTGFYYIDEHLHVLEFASWKLGTTPASSLPVEFVEHIRASILPAFVWLISKILQPLNLYNPFTIAFLLRLLTGFASWLITCLLCLHLGKNMKTEKGKKLLIILSLFLWFIPFLSVRFTSENIAGITFLYGAYILLRNLEKENNHLGGYMAAGFLFGISVFVRAPLAIAIVVFTIWLIHIKKTGWKNIFAAYSAALVAISLNTLLDIWFYGEPVCSLFNLTNLYLHHCVHGVEGIGANPWWFYVEQFTLRITPPISLLLLAAFVTGIYKNLKDPFVWIIIPFIIIHSIIRHKELRFLFPVLYLFIYITVLGIDYLLTKKGYLKWHPYIYTLSLILILPLLLFRTFYPANTAVNYYRYLCNDISGKNIPLFIMQNNNTHQAWNTLNPSLFLLENTDDYSYILLNKNFYKNPGAISVNAKNTDEIKASLESLHTDTAYYLDTSGGEFILSINGYKVSEVYSLSPKWLAHFMATYCYDHAAGWKIYLFSKT